jgi:uncharacterized membrane protein YqjE
MLSADPEPESNGLLASLRTLADGLFAGVQDRLALFSVELQEEKARLIRSAVFLGVAFMAAALALAFLSLLVVAAFWDKARLTAIGGVAAVYVIACVAAALALRKEIRGHPRPFKDSLEEIARDREWTRRESLSSREED